MGLITIVLASALHLGAQTPAATGVIAGCIVDRTERRLPGVTVAATGEGRRHTTEADKSGCYELKGLTPGSYRVTARLPGFTNVTRDNVVVTPGPVTGLDLTMNVSSICECVLLTGTLADHFKRADAVLHVRITGPASGQPMPSEYYRHAAAVLHALKHLSGGTPPATVSLLEHQANAAPGPYDVDQELVAFLRSVRADEFAIVNGDRGLIVNNQKHAMVFLVRDGQIVDAPTEFSRYIGATLDSFMYELRALGSVAGPPEGL